VSYTRNVLHNLKIEVLYKLVELAEVEYRAVSSLRFRDQKQSTAEVSVKKGIAFIAPIDRNMFTCASTGR